jgi:hypothetical protein
VQTSIRSGSARWIASAFTALAIAAALVACASSNDGAGAPSCVQVPSADCKPLVDPPTFDAIYTQIIQPTCGSGRGTCHSAGASASALSFGNAGEAYAMLTGQGGSSRVLAHDAACSPLMKRIMSTDPAFRMPRGSTPLSAPETCAITKWIESGAAR